MANEAANPSTLSQASIAALEQGQTIEAIKIVRLERGLGLKESKDLVDAYLKSRPDLQRRLAAAQAEARQGFVRWLIIFLALAAAAAYFLTTLPANAAVVTGSWKTQVESCTMILEEQDRSLFQLRVVQPGAGIKVPCVPSDQAFTDAFAKLMQEATPFQRLGRETVRLFMGRLVELPGMSRELSSTARQAKEWNLSAGKPVRGDTNTFVTRLMLKSDALRDLLGSGLRLARVSVEKVLIPSRDMVARWKRGASYPNKRVPYDCLLWVEVEPAR